MSNSSTFDELNTLLAVDQIPAMPYSALTVLQLDNDVTKVNINDLVRPIESDPGLASQVLKFLNSSYFGFQSTISNVKQGIALVGIRIVKNFILWKAIFSLIPKSKTSSFDVAVLWQDSLRRAMFTRFLLVELKKGDPETAFAGALLQDMAIPLLLKKKGADYSAVLDRLTSSHNNLRLSQLESDTFGWNHADAGKILGANWKLPATLVELIGNHWNVEEFATNIERKPENAAIVLSAFLPSAAQTTWAERADFIKCFNLFAPGKEWLITNIFEKVDQEFEQYAIIIQIPKPKKTMASYAEMD